MFGRSSSLSRNNAIAIFFSALVAAGIAAHLTSRLPDVPVAVPVATHEQRGLDRDRDRIASLASMPWRP